jgi:hypothetical protein
MPTKNAQVRYRRFIDLTNSLNDYSLKEALLRALAHRIGGVALRDDMAQRLFQPQGEPQVYALNENLGRQHWFYGQLAGFEPGEHMPVLERSFAGRADVNIGQQAAPRGYDFLRGLLYFLVVDSHVLVLETGTLSTSRLERYLTWILKDRVGLMNQDGHVLLEKRIEIQEEGGGLQEVKEIIFRPEPTKVSDVAIPAGFRGRNQEVTRLLDTLQADEKAMFGIFNALGVPSADLARLMATLPADAELKAEVRLLVKEKNPASLISTYLGFGMQ